MSANISSILRPLRFIAAAAALALLAAGCAGLEQRERELTFRASRDTAVWFTGLPAEVRDVYLPVEDRPGAPRLHAWWWPDEDPQAPVVLYLHGARWNLTGNLFRIAQLRRFGFSVFAIDYRGFGSSDGDLPSEASVYEDARAAWRFVAAHAPEASRRLIYGHSLGGAVAVDLAASLPPGRAGARGLIVESSFTSFADMAAEVTRGFVPASMLTQKFDSIGKIAQLHMPVLIVHGAGDRYVPVRFSEALYAAAPSPKRLFVVENGTHNNSLVVGNSEYRHVLFDFFGLPDPGEAGVHVETPATPGATRG
jgi:alpha-beta hydrolase superfamily lysophospholipase